MEATVTLQPRKGRPWAWLLVALAGGAILLAIALWPRNENKWDTMRQSINRLKQETKTRRETRTVLNGVAMPGNAWTEYNLALADAQSWSDAAVLSQFLGGFPKVDRAAVEQAVAKHARTLQHLRLGARRTEGQRAYNWDRPDSMEIPSLLATRQLANLAVVQAHFWIEAGRTQDAADLLLDTTVFARDLATNAPLLSDLIGIAVYNLALDELRNLIQSGKLTPQQLTALEKKLETVDRDYPKLGPALANDALGTTLVAMEMAAGGFGGWWELAKQGGWRFAFSSEQMTIHAFEERQKFSQRSLKLDGMDYASARKEAEAIGAEAESSINPMTKLSTPGFSRALSAHREPLARLRLLRAAASYLATGEMPELEDPFGTRIHYEQDGTKLKLWSDGRDGKSDDGTGGWTAAPAQKDIVLEIPR